MLRPTTDDLFQNPTFVRTKASSADEKTSPSLVSAKPAVSAVPRFGIFAHRFLRLPFWHLLVLPTLPVLSPSAIPTAQASESMEAVMDWEAAHGVAEEEIRIDARAEVQHEPAAGQTPRSVTTEEGDTIRPAIAVPRDGLITEAGDITPIRITVPPLLTSRIDFPDECVVNLVIDKEFIETSGQAEASDFFLSPTREGRTTIYVQLARGETVPIELTVDSKAAPRNVTLRLRKSAATLDAPVDALRSTLRDRLPSMIGLPFSDLLSTLVTTLENNESSDGLLRLPTGANAPLTSGALRTVERLHPLSVHIDGVWQTREMTVTRLVVKNGKLRRAVIDETALLSDGVLAFAATKPALEPGESLRFYVFEGL